MDIQVNKQKSVVVVAVSGDVDAQSAPQLDDCLSELVNQGEQCYVIDLSAVPFMDSSGLATLVKLFKRIRIGHGDVKLAGLRPEILKVFQLTRLNRVFDIFENQSEAVADFG